MKKISSFLLALPVIPALVLSVSAANTIAISDFLSSKEDALKVLLGILAVMVLLSVIVAASRPFRKKRRKAVAAGTAVLVYLAAIAVLGVNLYSIHLYKADAGQDVMSGAVLENPTENTSPVEEIPSETPGEETAPPETRPPVVFAPAMTGSSDPANWNVKWEIIENDNIVKSYERLSAISFGDPEDYFALPGIATFRGNNYRNCATYGTAEVTSEAMKTVWSHRIGSYNGWGGCAWTGQPLLVQWDDETKQIMNLYNSKKAKEDLVEVVYAMLDGHIHFYDLADGTETRPAIKVNMNFKGAGALDPRGYPLLYVGSGVNGGGKNAHMYIISLIDGSILWEHGAKDPYAGRNWSAFDSSPLVDAETDTLIWPGENGILYTMELNTIYDKAAGTISVSPDNIVKARYSSAYSEDGRYLGMETSASIVDHYLYASENGGLFFCVDLNTMELVWTQDTLDDSNSSPVFEWGADGNGYLYTAPSLHWTAEKSKGFITIYKLDAQTGEIMWEYTKDCVTVKDVSGGVQATPLLGKEGSKIENLIIYVIARTPGTYDGVMIAFDKETGEIVWEMDTKNYTWSSPTAVYTDDGRAYIITVNASGKIRLVDGETGEILSDLGLAQTTEASPVVFGNMFVIGTREGVYGIKVY